MKATQANMEGSEGDTQRCRSKQEDCDDQPKQKELVPKRGATSVVWTWFGYEKSDTDQKTVRRESTDEIHKSTVECSNNKPQTQTLQEAFARGTPYGKESRRRKEITAAIAIYICKDMAPIYTVEKPGFRELTLDPRYTMPS